MAPHALAAAVAAHPLTEPSELPLSPLTVAAGAALVVLLVAAFDWPRAAAAGADAPAPPRRRAPWVATRAAGLVLLVGAVVAGRAGRADELDNLAPALVVGFGWPALVAASVAAGRVWDWVDPFDSLARALDRGGAPDPDGDAGERTAEPADVRPAFVAALAWTAYLGVHPDPLSPRAVGAALGLYAIVTLAGCLALGRGAWLRRAEVAGVFLSWVARTGRGLARWTPPRGAAPVLGALAGGLLFETARRTALWGELNASDDATAWAALGWAAASAAGAGVAAVAARSGPAAAIALVPATAGVAVAAALERNRLFTSAQLLPELVTDPLGRGWDPLGLGTRALDPAPLGDAGLAALQVALVAAGCVAGAIAARRAAGRAGWPAAVAAAAVAAAGAAVVVA
ncbi:MAG TPA: hypothetical protein VHJ34_02990 [Actinomycetota bacterium]|nr:hypothetical protein [Actinomycetota bacterium]